MNFKPCEEGEAYGSLSIIGIDQPTYLMPSVLVNGKVVRVNTNDEESAIDYDKRVDAIKKLIVIDEKISTLTI
jgi:sporulation protein YlmC with PRC-barrel domain